MVLRLSFCDAEEKEFLRDIQKLIARPIPVVEDHPHVMHEPFARPPVVATDLSRQRVATGMAAGMVADVVGMAAGTAAGMAEAIPADPTGDVGTATTGTTEAEIMAAVSNRHVLPPIRSAASRRR